jgi:hypothetical protein
MATRKKPCTEATSIQRGLPPAYYQAYALLQTLRALASHEDELCALLADIHRSGRLGARARRELTELLHTLPAMSLHAEIEALFSALEEQAA